MTDYSTHPDYVALLATVCEDPDADLPRLVLADWLDERGGRAGEIHAGFIRRQIGGEVLTVPLMVLAQLPPMPGREPHQYSFNGSRAGIAEVFYDTAGGVRLIYSRGFVSAVTLTQAAFLGGGCDRCGGSGRLAIHGRTHGDCLTCDGTGRTPGLAAALFAAHPITTVTLSDAHQFRVIYGYIYERFPNRPGAHFLPDELPLFLRGELWADDLAGPFATPAIAHAALSRQAIAYGRHAAGLTPLPAPADAPAAIRGLSVAGETNATG